MAKTPYQPPEQSKIGQLIDSLFLLALVVASLFAPVYFGLAGGGKAPLEFADKSWKGMGQNAVMQAQWDKLGLAKDADTGAIPQATVDMIASRFDYSFSLPALIVTAVVVIVYFVFVFRLSEKEYKDVISERFDK
jgi:hypothetical protein